MNRFRLHNKYKAVVIGGSAGSFQGIVKVLSKLPKDFPLPVIMCLHRLKHIRHGFTEALSLKSIKQVVEPNDKEPIKKGYIYVAPSNYHMSVELGHYFALSTEEMVNNSRPAIDITFSTAAYVYREKLIGILLSGANRDGSLGMKAISEKGGLTIVQDPKECMIETMTSSALKAATIDHVLKVDDLVIFFEELNKQYK